MGLSPPTTVVGRARPEEDDVVVASGKLLKQGRGRTTGLSKCFWQERDFVLSSSRAEGRQRRRPSLTYYKGGKEKGRVLLDSTPGRDPSRASGEGQRYEFALKGVDERGLPCELRLAARSGAERDTWLSALKATSGLSSARRVATSRSTSTRVTV